MKAKKLHIQCLIIIICMSILPSCQNNHPSQKSQTENTITTKSKSATQKQANKQTENDIEIWDKTKLTTELKNLQNSEIVTVINFWATWCKPCVEELPYFENLHKKYSKDQLKVILVSLDFIEDIDTKVKPFLKQNPQSSEIALLDAGKPKYWIDLINKEWSGAIPATIIGGGPEKSVKNNYFKEGEIDEQTLNNQISRRLVKQ